MAKFYAVQVGLTPGVYGTWAECEVLVKGYPGAKYKSFTSEQEAYNFAFPNARPNANQVAPTRPQPVLPYRNSRQPEIEIYVDGSYKDGRYAWAFAVIENDHVIEEGYGLGTNQEAAAMHNVAGELSAAMRAARWAAQNQKRVVIKHDLEGTAKWITGEFKAGTPFTKQYVQFMQPYKEWIDFSWVRGHNGNKWNEYVDGLATRAFAEFA